jgi:hypothetical protein
VAAKLPVGVFGSVRRPATLVVKVAELDLADTKDARVAVWEKLACKATRRAIGGGTRVRWLYHDDVSPRGDFMSRTLIIRGRYVGRTFIPDGPLPDAEGSAELVITPAQPRPSASIANAFGTASVLRSADDILAEVRAERDEWGDR